MAALRQLVPSVCWIWLFWRKLAVFIKMVFKVHPVPQAFLFLLMPLPDQEIHLYLHTEIVFNSAFNKY